MVARADYGIPVCEWWVGWASQTISFFFFLSFRTGDGLGFIRFCSWDVSEGDPLWARVGSVVGLVGSVVGLVGLVGLVGFGAQHKGLGR